MLPSYLALERHVVRAAYVLKRVFSISLDSCTVLNECYDFGWIRGENKLIEIDWDDPGVVESFISSHVTCGCKSGCNTRRCKCISSNAKCNIKCKCKNCTNKGTCESSTASRIGSLPIQEEEMLMN